MNSVATMDINEEQTYMEQFGRLENGLGAEPAWLSDLRRAAMLRFADLGLPTRNDEEWRFTNPATFTETQFTVADARKDANWLAENGSAFKERVAACLMTERDHLGLAFLNGRSVAVDTGLSTIDSDGGVVIASLSDFIGGSDADRVSNSLAFVADFQSHSMTALNTALFEDGAYIFIPRNTVVERPIEIVYVSCGDGLSSMNTPRTLVIAEENSQATIIETWVSADGARRLTNAVTEIVVGDNAVIDHYKSCDEGAEGIHIGTMGVHLGNGSNFSSHNFTLGGKLVRNEITATLKGEHAECTLNGLYVGDGDRIVDNHTNIDHAMPNCNSHEVYKGILDDRSRGVFNGKIFVRLDAQKTDAKQTNKTLLLSPQARIDTKPQLEILADDVKCTHGATIGQLDPNQIFYLQARGLSMREARNLLTYAFAGDVIQRVKVPALRDSIDARVHAMLPQE